MVDIKPKYPQLPTKDAAIGAGSFASLGFGGEMSPPAGWSVCLALGVWEK